MLIISVGARKRRADADFWARERCADYPKQPNERGKGAPTAKHGRGKYAQIKRLLGSKKFRETDSWNGDISAKRAPHGRGRRVQILEKR